MKTSRSPGLAEPDGRHSTIGNVELGRIELARHTDTRPLAAPEVPDRLLVAGDLTVKEGREFAWHGGAPMGRLGVLGVTGLRHGLARRREESLPAARLVGVE